MSLREGALRQAQCELHDDEATFSWDEEIASGYRPRNDING